MNFLEVGVPHCSLKKVENRYLPPHRREEGISKNFNGERSHHVRTMAL